MGLSTVPSSENHLLIKGIIVKAPLLYLQSRQIRRFREKYNTYTVIVGADTIPSMVNPKMQLITRRSTAKSITTTVRGEGGHRGLEGRKGCGCSSYRGTRYLRRRLEMRGQRQLHLHLHLHLLCTGGASSCCIYLPNCAITSRGPANCTCTCTCTYSVGRLPGAQGGTRRSCNAHTCMYVERPWSLRPRRWKAVGPVHPPSSAPEGLSFGRISFVCVCSDSQSSLSCHSQIPQRLSMPRPQRRILYR